MHRARMGLMSAYKLVLTGWIGGLNGLCQIDGGV